MSKASRGSSTEKYKSVFATRLRLLFDEKPNATQAQLSELIGVTRQTVSQYVNGISEPGYDALVKIADYFDVSLDYLLGRSEAKTTDISIQAACKATGLSEESIRLLQTYMPLPEGEKEIIGGINFNDSHFNYDAYGRSAQEAFVLVNEFIHFALDGCVGRGDPFSDYLSFRKYQAASHTYGKEVASMTPPERTDCLSRTTEAIMSALGAGICPLFPDDAATLFRRNLCDAFNRYLEEKYPSEGYPLRHP